MLPRLLTLSLAPIYNRVLAAVVASTEVFQGGLLIPSAQAWTRERWPLPQNLILCHDGTVSMVPRLHHVAHVKEPPGGLRDPVLEQSPPRKGQLPGGIRFGLLRSNPPGTSIPTLTEPEQLPSPICKGRYRAKCLRTWQCHPCRHPRQGDSPIKPPWTSWALAAATSKTSRHRTPHSTPALQISPAWHRHSASSTVALRTRPGVNLRSCAEATRCQEATQQVAAHCRLSLPPRHRCCCRRVAWSRNKARGPQGGRQGRGGTTPGRVQQPRQRLRARDLVMKEARPPWSTTAPRTP